MSDGPVRDNVAHDSEAEAPGASGVTARLASLAPAGSFRLHVGSTFAAQAVALALLVAQDAVVARWLGPDGKGTLAVALLVPVVLNALLNPALAVSYVYFTANRRITAGELAGQAVVLSATAGAVAYAVVGLATATGLTDTVVPDVPTGFLLAVTAGVPLLVAFEQLHGIVRGQQRIHAVNLVQVAQRTTTLVLTALALVALSFGVGGAIAAWLGGFAVAVAALAVLLGRRGISFRPSLRARTLKQVLGYGMRAHAANLAQFFNYRLDLFFVNAIAGAGTAGIYTVSVVLAELVWFLPNAAAFVILPRAAGSSRAEMNRFTPRVFRWALALSVAGGLLLAAIGQPLIRLVFSGDFADAYTPLLWLMPGTVLLGGAKVLTSDLAGRGYPHYNAVTAATALALTVALDLVLIPDHGATGAAAASTVAYSAVFVLALAFYARVRRIPDPPSAP